MADETTPAAKTGEGGEGKPADGKDQTTTTTPPPATGDEALRPEGAKALEEWKSRARKAEREAKEQAERIEKLESASKSEADKAIDKARKEARKEAETEFAKERRSDRLRVAVAGHARELADVDDVVLNIERGEIEDLFNAEGQVDGEALQKRLVDLLKAKPHLKASGVGKPEGDADGGRGEGGGGEGFNEEIRRQFRASR